MLNLPPADVNGVSFSSGLNLADRTAIPPVAINLPSTAQSSTRCITEFHFSHAPDGRANPVDANRAFGYRMTANFCFSDRLLKKKKQVSGLDCVPLADPFIKTELTSSCSNTINPST